jgi:hypothetical protein
MLTRIQYDTSDEIVRVTTFNNLRQKTDLTFFERGLMNRDIIPKSYFDKRARSKDVLEAQAQLVYDGTIEVLQEDGVFLWYWIGHVPDDQEGRSLHPKLYHPPKNRNPVSIGMTKADRNLLYYAGGGSIPVGIQNICQFIRKNRRLFREQYTYEIGREAL